MGWFFNPAIATQLVPWSSGVFQMQRGGGGPPPQTLPLLYIYFFFLIFYFLCLQVHFRFVKLVYCFKLTFRLVEFIIVF